MNPAAQTMLASALVLAAANEVYGQTAPATNAPPAAAPVAPPYPGLINEYLRSTNAPYMSKWDIGGSERLRYEDHEGYGIAGLPGTPGAPNNDFRDHGADVANDYLMSRLRLHLGYTDAWWGAYVEGRSSLEWGDQRFAYPNVPAVAGTVARRSYGPEYDPIDLNQAYVNLGNLKEFPLSLKVGRQELSYGEERLVGAFDWNNMGRVFDAAKLRWQNEWLTADLFTSRPVIPEEARFDVDDDYDFFSGIYATSAKLPKNNVDLYFLARNASPKASSAEPSPQFPQPSARDIYTLGGRIKSKPGELGGFDYSLEGAYQFGDFRDTRPGAATPTRRLEQEAFMVVAQGGYTFKNLWAKPRLGLEYDYASGDSNPTDGKHETFENLFPTNHKFYGSMDFLSLQNMHDLSASLKLQPHPKVSLSLQSHMLFLASANDSFYGVTGAARGGTAATSGTGYGVNPGYNTYLGTDLTATAGYAMTRYARVEGAYSHFFHGTYISETWAAPTAGARDADFCYLQLTVTF